MATSIVRSPSREKWTTINNRLIEDRRLGPMALAIMTYLLSKPDDWTVMVPDLCKRFRCKEYKIRVGLQQMEAAGYAKLEPTRSADGTLGGRRYTVTEDPTPTEPVNTEDGKNPTSGKIQGRKNSDVGKIGCVVNTEYGISNSTEAVKTDAKASGEGTNGVPVAAPPAMHTNGNGSTQPEPPASPGLPSVAVNGASPAAAAGAGAAEPKLKRSARNGKASANGSTPAEPDPERAAESKLVFGELCAWLGLDWTRLPANTRGRLNKTTAALLDAGLGAAAVARARDAWRFDWRAKGGQVPDLSQVEGLVARAGAGLTASETPGHYPRYGVHDAPARVKMSEVF